MKRQGWKKVFINIQQLLKKILLQLIFETQNTVIGNCERATRYTLLLMWYALEPEEKNFVKSCKEEGDCD